MKKNLLVLFILVASLLSAAVAKEDSIEVSAKERRMAERITAEQLRDFLYFVASDEMGGRDTPSRGLDITAKFLALNLKRWGFKPAGDKGSFFQTMSIVSEKRDEAKTSLKLGNRDLRFGEDFYVLSGDGEVTGELVFASHGWSVKSKDIDAFNGLDVKDKIVVVYANSSGGALRIPERPDSITAADLKGEKGVDWADARTNAKNHGAKGLIMVASPKFQKNWSNLSRSFSSRRYVSGLEKKRDPMPFALVNEEVGKTLMGQGAVYAKTSFKSNQTATLSVATKVEKTSTQNVVALWEGRDPKRKAEMVAIGAHYDHVGTRPNAKGEDKIWNGADDDGSGTVAVLAIAEALSKAKVRPKRSILLVWHAGEEKGLWGSEYFNKYPTVNIKNVVAQLNIDMIGRSRKTDDANPKNKYLSGTDEIYVIGSEMMSSTLGKITKGVNASYLGLNYNYKYDDPKDTNRFFFRSDHFNYAVNGIPIAFWFDGVHEDYHQAGDQPEKIDYQKMENITRTIFLTLWEIAQLKQRPAIDKELPPELTQR